MSALLDGSGRRQYGQQCPVALALDVVGDRWSILLLRELFAGPKRFTDLAIGLPGIGTAVLSERLRGLEQHGIVSRRRLRPPAPALVYELTARGRALDPVLTSLAQWGTAYLRNDEGRTRRGRWLLQAMAAVAVKPAAGVENANFILDGEESHLVVGSERLAARDGLRDDARVTIRGSARQLHQMATSGNAAPSYRRFAVEGDRRSAERLLNHLILGMRRAVKMEWTS